MPHDMRYLTNPQLAAIYQEIPISPERRIVLLDVGGRKDLSATEHNENIYCITTDGEVVWQVQAPETMHERDSFISLSRNEKGQLCADRFFGNEFVLDPETGVAHHTGWHK